MINSFHMNPWLYLLAIPICYFLRYTSWFVNPENIKLQMTIAIAVGIFILLLLVYLYINNIIGLFDLIILALILGIYLYLCFFGGDTGINPRLLALTILPILATITSFIYNLN